MTNTAPSLDKLIRRLTNESPYDYHPHRKDGLDKHLRRINENDFRAGTRCTCPDCCAKYEECRAHRQFILRCGRHWGME